MKTRTTEELVTTLRLCKTCRKETEHEIHSGEGCTAYICIPCKRQKEIFDGTRE